MERVLVAGATGTTGNKVINLLKASQYFVPVAMVRKAAQKADFEAMGVEVVVGDLEGELKHATDNIDKIVFAAGSGGEKVIAVDQEGAKKLIDAGAAIALKKFVMLSSMGAENPEQADDLQEYLRAKHKADEHLKGSGIPYAIIRPGTLTNTKGSGKISLGNNLDPSGRISRDDVAQTLVRALHDDTALNETFEILEGDTLIGKALDKTT